MALLHTHGDGGEGLLHALEEIFLHGILDTLKIIPFLFLTYLLMEFIEHRAGDRAEKFMKRAGAFAPIVGGTLGAVPQCGFSAAAANLYAGRVVSVGTLIAAGQSSIVSNAGYVALFPCLFLCLLMLSFNLFGNGLRDAFNPSLRGAED